MSDKFFAPIVIMVVLTTILTPVLLKVVFKDKPESDGNIPEKEPAAAAK